MPEFLKRAKAFVERYLPQTNSVVVVEDLKTRWIKEPYLTGYFLVFDDGGLPYAHMTSWITESYGKPFVFVYQAYCDKYSKLGTAANAVLDQCGQWASQLNIALQPGVQIQEFEFSTWRDAETWAKYFTKMGYESVKTRSIIRAKLKLA